jgi:hypothetical protein
MAMASWPKDREAATFMLKNCFILDPEAAFGRPDTGSQRNINKGLEYWADLVRNPQGGSSLKTWLI